MGFNENWGESWRFGPWSSYIKYTTTENEESDEEEEIYIEKFNASFVKVSEEAYKCNSVSTLKKGASLENLMDDLNLSDIIDEKFLGVYLYKTKNRWCIGADYTSNYAWFFTKNHNLENAQFYKYENDDESVHRTSLKVDKIESTESFFVRES